MRFKCQMIFDVSHFRQNDVCYAIGVKVTVHVLPVTPTQEMKINKWRSNRMLKIKSDHVTDTRGQNMLCD